MGGGIRGSSGSRSGAVGTEGRVAGSGGGGGRAENPLALLLIELIFCLGSIWANVELAFLASVINYSMISMRSTGSFFKYILSLRFVHRMDQNERCLPIHVACDPPETYFWEMKN